MRRVNRLFVVPIICLAITMTSVPVATADCIKNAGDAIFAVLSGGLSTAACEISELVQAIKGFIQTVNDLSNKVQSDFKSVSNNSVAAVDSAADKVASSGSAAQADLSKDVAEAKAMASSFAVAPRANVQMPAAPNHAAMAPRTNVRISPMSRGMTAGQARSSQGAPQPPANHMAAAAPMLKQWADPQQLHAALQRGAQQLETLKRTVDQDDIGRINAAAQKARSQAKSHISDATGIMQTALMAPLTALIKTLDDLVRDPKKLLDPIATINTMVDNIVQSIVDTMNKVADVITKDAMSTLAGVEPAVHQAQGTANESADLLGLMRRANKDQTKAALEALEAKLNAMGMHGAMVQSHTLATPQGSFRFASVQGMVHTSLQQAVVPSRALASHLSSSWAAIRNKHAAASSRQLSPSVKQTGQSELDRMFRGKTPAQVAQIKQNLLNQAKLRFGGDPKLMAAIEQNLNDYVRVHVTPSTLVARPHQGGGQQGPGTRMLNPQPLPPRSGNFQRQKLPAAQR